MGIYSITTQGETALTAATARTALQLIGHASCKAKILEWGVGFDGVSAVAEPVQVRLLRQTTGGTKSAATTILWEPDDPTALSLGFQTITVEPTYSDVLVHTEVHPQTGVFFQYMPGREVGLDNSTTSRIGIVCTAPAGVNVAAYLIWQE